MLEWLKEPGFVGTHATMGADLSQLMATLFTLLFVVGWVQAKKRQANRHHWLMFGGMVAMLAFFTSYYLFRNLGVLAFAGKEGFGGSQALYDNVFKPLLTFHIVLVIVGIVMAVYMIVLGFRAQIVENGSRRLADRILRTSWTKVITIFLAVAFLVALYLGSMYFANRLSLGRVLVWVGFLILVATVFAIEIGIQKKWPNAERRHRVLGRFTMVLYCVLFFTGTATYTMLYILFPGKIG